MPHWSNSLPPTSKRIAFNLRRTPTDGSLRAVITSERLLVCTTHWWTGRTRPCEGDQCDACHAGAPGRTHCYVSALEHGSRDHFIFECTAQAAAPFACYFDTYRTVRGCYFTACRPKRRRNAAVEIACKPFDLGNVVLPAAPDIPAAMAVIWQLPRAGIRIAKPADEVQQIDLDPSPIDRMRFNPADGLPTSSPRRSNGEAS